ncbi:MAG: ferritin [[Clostridium] fimetarium]|nr:ferritin [Alistipes timonensis]MCM1406322.1 ferritin [[Clostridium] fimetarium]
MEKTVEKAINEQINAEFWSAYLYLSMSMHFAAEGYNGIANWFAIQFKEEQDHATIFMNYINSRGGKVELAPIAAVDTSWASPQAAFEATLAHERKVTAMINNLYATADKANDIATKNMLSWFVDEQVEEEETARGYIDALRMIGDNGYGLYMFDKELAARVYNTPAPLAAKA